MTDTKKTVDMTPEEVDKLIADRKRLRDEQKALTKLLQKVKQTNDENFHVIAVKVPKDWAADLKEFAEGQNTSVSKVHRLAVQEFLKANGFEAVLPPEAE